MYLQWFFSQLYTAAPPWYERRGTLGNKYWPMIATPSSDTSAGQSGTARAIPKAEKDWRRRKPQAARKLLSVSMFERTLGLQWVCCACGHKWCYICMGALAPVSLLKMNSRVLAANGVVATVERCLRPIGCFCRGRFCGRPRPVLFLGRSYFPRRLIKNIRVCRQSASQECSETASNLPERMQESNISQRHVWLLDTPWRGHADRASGRSGKAPCR